MLSVVLYKAHHFFLSSILPAPTQITLEEANLERSHSQVIYYYKHITFYDSISSTQPSQLLPVRNRAPPYGQRHGWVPRSLEVV